MAEAAKPWIVLKYGGTSVATAERWERIAARVRTLADTHRVWIVVSALAGVTSALERAIREAQAGEPARELEAVRSRHEELARAIGLDAAARGGIGALLDSVDSWLTGVRLTGEAPPRLVARILATGELASTRLGVAALARHGVAARWVDARDLLEGEPRAASDVATYLDVNVPTTRRPELGDAVAAGSAVVLTQGFIARTSEGETCVLGRGGSDTSGALFAALLGASLLEIWTDVPGLFTADPRLVPEARLIRRIGYREAEELAATGAKVLHPRCLAPAEAAGVPIRVASIDDPEEPGTLIEAAEERHPAVTAVTCRTGVTLLSLSTLSMWTEAGFLARAFAPFEELGVSVDLLATSVSTISLTVDRLPGGADGPTLRKLVDRLEPLCRVRVVHPCAVVSIVGRRIRAALPEIGAALPAFRERPVHLVSDSAEDRNLSFVVDEDDAAQLVVRLHERLFRARQLESRFGPTWERLGDRTAPKPGGGPWWRARSRELVDLVRAGKPRYVYHLSTVIERARALRGSLPSVAQLYYSMKANAHPQIVAVLVQEGFGIECVSAAEVLRAREVAGRDVPILFTPNFCPVDEYETAFGAGAEVVVDGAEPIEAAPAQFGGCEVGLRLDPGQGRGHHDKVKTAGPHSKFGCAFEDVPRVLEAAARAGTRIVGLHAHVGSGVFDPDAWAETGHALVPLLDRFPDVTWIDLGGGLGVPGRSGQAPLDLDRVERGLAALRGALGAIELRLEPGRFLVSEAGVLVSPVTQVRTKGGVRFVGLAAGMNALIRPALYGAWHGIHNLSRLDEPPAGYAHVVGPICESADVLGLDRLLPETRPGDVLLVENAGAYGAVMASEYNLRPRPDEVVLE